MAVVESDKDSVKRRKLVEEINVALGDVAAEERRVEETRAKYEKILNDQRSAVGTAEAEVRKAKQRYNELSRRLSDLLPAKFTIKEED